MYASEVFFLAAALVYKHSPHSHSRFSSPPSTQQAKEPLLAPQVLKKKFNGNRIDNLAIFRSDVIRKRLRFYIFVMVVWIFCVLRQHIRIRG